MMYRPHTQMPADGKRRKARKNAESRLLSLSIVVLAMVTAILLYAFVWHGDEEMKVDAEPDLSAETVVAESDDMSGYWRPSRDIAKPDFNKVTYRQLFDDSNYVQLAAARAGGLDPLSIGDPQTNKSLIHIYNTRLYIVDTMYHSMPYLVPDAVSLLRCIAERFQTLMKEQYSNKGDYRIIVTSALRTESSVRALRRVNRNATDTSCHLYGTTFDISAQRYRHSSGVDTVVEFCKQVLAQTLNELRCEGMCYVKYERGSCFHITVRNGDVPIPAYSNPLKATKEKTVRRAIPVTETKTKPAGNNGRAARKSERAKQQKQNTEERHAQPTKRKDELSERERLSFEHFERRN